MKRYLVILLLPLFFAACDPNEKVKELEAERDSILAQSQNKDQIINGFVQSLNEVQDNLNSIKEKEKIIRVNSEGTSLNETAKESINNDILEIYKLMLDNKKKLSSLRSQLKKSNMKISEFKKMIDKMTRQMEAKDAEIETLKDQLAKKNLDIANLNQEISKIKSNFDSTTTVKNQVIEEKNTEINTAFFVVGNSKELMQHQIITKQGGFIGIGKIAQLRENFNRDYFTQIDIRKKTSIPVFQKKVKLLTTHPASSYFLSGTKTVDSLIIKNPKEFWSVSKYLVIMAE
jgi:DNA repair exonuclease SbcCD ATPase subunit